MGSCCGTSRKSELRQPLTDRRRRRLVVEGTGYTVDQQLGEGSYAVVYLCTSPEGRRVAIKESVLDPESNPNAMQEVEVLRALKHPNIVELLQSQSTALPSGSFEVLMVMEYCGSSLVSQIQERKATRNRFIEPEIMDVLWHIGNALAYLHSRNPPIAHRDLKAENILRAAQGGPWKLCDFGSATTFAYECKTSADISRAKEEIERNTTMCYNAPEMLDLWAKRRIDEKVDTWALGVLQFYLAFLALPFEDNLLQITQCKYTIPSEDGFSPGFFDLLRRLLDANPSTRLDSWHVLAQIHELQPALGPVPSAPAPKPVQPLR
eukprot:TRINITY_DN6544_c0_g1_i1.p1 TRINITY_DN6544_c0_g1~~TRINITY_DN6544_c0_g1_i1.p1  ORF type:complete len:331 (+),score=40.92 TRINITY_DN6544_c0_g1_i1:31-993(+)